MSKSQPSSVKFWIIASVTVAAAAYLAALAWPVVPHALRNQSQYFSRLAASVTPAQSQADYQLATLLNPYNLDAQRALASSYLTTGHDQQALDAVNRSGQGIVTLRLRVRAYLELDRLHSASHAANQLLAQSTSDPDMLLAGEALAGAGRTQAAVSLASRVASSETATRLAYVSNGNMPLAYVLASTGLLRSPQAILTKLPDSYERDVLLAAIDNQLADVTSAKYYARLATGIDPTAPAPRQLLAVLTQNSKNLSAFKTQQLLLGRIQSQSP
jgi:hypothetical protein